MGLLIYRYLLMGASIGFTLLFLLFTSVEVLYFHVFQLDFGSYEPQLGNRIHVLFFSITGVILINLMISNGYRWLLKAFILLVTLNCVGIILLQLQILLTTDFGEISFDRLDVPLIAFTVIFFVELSILLAILLGVNGDALKIARGNKMTFNNVLSKVLVLPDAWKTTGLNRPSIIFRYVLGVLLMSSVIWALIMSDRTRPEIIGKFEHLPQFCEPLAPDLRESCLQGYYDSAKHSAFIGMWIVYPLTFFGVIWLSRKLINGARERAVQVQAKQEKHREESILFLRCFKDDQVLIPTSFWTPLRWLTSISRHQKPLDYILVEEIGIHGNIKALGNPNEEEIPFGAVRVYCPKNDDTWKDTVTHMALNAKAIIICVGTEDSREGKGTRWELDMIKRRGFDNKTLYLVKPEAKTLEDNGKVMKLCGFSCPGNSKRWLGGYRSEDNQEYIGHGKFFDRFEYISLIKHFILKLEGSCR